VRPSRLPFSGALLTLAFLSVLVLGLLNVFDRTTRMVRFGGQAQELGASIQVAAHALSRDVRAAGAGISAAAALVARANNSGKGARFSTALGDVAVRAGTDQLQIRGVLGSPLFRVQPAQPPASGETTFRIASRHPTPKWIRVTAPGAVGFGLLPQVGEWGGLLARAGRTAAKVFCAVSDEEGHQATAVLTSAAVEGGRREGVLEVKVRFDDPDALPLSPGGAAAARRLRGELSLGLLDDLTYFVARGEPGAPPDYFAAADPESLAFPHPYLAVARFVGGGRYEVVRIADEIEDLQVGYRISEGGASRWVPDRPDVAPRLVDDLGRPLVSLVRVGLVEKSPVRDLRVELAGNSHRSRLEGVRLLDAPPPTGTRLGAGPVGYSPYPGQGASFARRAQLLSYVPRRFWEATR